MEQELRQAVHAAAARAEVTRAVGAVYAELQAAIEARRPVCNASGRCCRFEEFGHRLYVSTLELAQFVADLPGARADAEVARGGRSLRVVSNDRWDGMGCPFQAGGLCGVHAARPFGCRIFFCDATSTAWQHDVYERTHARLRALHDELGVPYHYVEWRFALRALGLGH